MKYSALAVIALAAATLAACGPNTPPAPDAKPVPAAATSSTPTDYRNGWDDGDRRQFYHLSSGGEILPLTLLQLLERKKLPQEGSDGQLVPFMQNIERYGFIPDGETDQNPFGLPVGMTVAPSSLKTTTNVGFNCSTCHVGQLSVKGRPIRIDGGPNMIRLNDMFKDLIEESTAMLKDPPRLARFVSRAPQQRDANNKKVPRTGPAGSLKARVEERIEDLARLRAQIGYIRAMPVLAKQAYGYDVGYGRVDAFGVARNLIFGGVDDRNRRPQSAPASFPHMWGMRTTAWLQWGANINSVMERNIGQTLGVGAVYDIKTYNTSSRLDNLNTLEHLAYKLTPPVWQEDTLGPVDQAKVTRGRNFYDRQCASCHERPFEITPTGLIVYQLFRLSEVGTSPNVALNFDQPVFMPGGQQPFSTAAYNAIDAIKQEYYKQHKTPAATIAQWEGHDLRPLPEWKPSFRSPVSQGNQYPDSQNGRVYPAKPLAGVWATAPYLNNGSVANMWDLLTPPADRPKKFYVGSRDYDTANLGYVSTKDATAVGPLFEFDATKDGNSNAGHVYGTTLGDDDKRALIEFMKALRPGDIKKDPMRKASGTASGQP